MEAGGKDCEEETLQTAFKKLRVDAESLPGAVSVSEALAPRVASRAGLEISSVKPKLSGNKDNWHGCMRKSSRGASRTQRRRRSKSPILHPPKFTYCSTAAAALSPPSGCLKHQRLAVPEPAEPRPAVDGLTPGASGSAPQKEAPPTAAPGHASPLVFGSCAGYDARELPPVAPPTAPSSGQDAVSPGDARPSEEGGAPEKSDGAESGGGAPRRPGPAEAAAADFRSLSELHSSSSSCSCPRRRSSGSESQEEGGAAAAAAQGAEPPCRCRGGPRGWSGVEVYSFTGLRNVISECERNLPTPEDSSRTLSANAASAPPPPPPPSSSSSSSSSSGSPRSCSEQARAYVDDITIEDLSGYMEYYLYIPKKMSHMAEMMYT